jgi:hypothetical protein
MKIINEFKKYIALKACSNSEWDCVDFFLIYLDIDRIKYFLELIGHAEALKSKISTFGSFDIFDCLGTFHWSDEDDCDIFEYDNVLFLDIEDSEISNLKIPEAALTYNTVRVFPNGIQFIAYGKHTGEEYFTEVIYKNKLMDLLSCLG